MAGILKLKCKKKKKKKKKTSKHIKYNSSLALNEPPSVPHRPESSLASSARLLADNKSTLLYGLRRHRRTPPFSLHFPLFQLKAAPTSSNSSYLTDVDVVNPFVTPSYCRICGDWCLTVRGSGPASLQNAVVSEYVDQGMSHLPYAIRYE